MIFSYPYFEKEPKFLSRLTALGPAVEKRCFQNCYDQLNELSSALNSILHTDDISIELNEIIEKLKTVGTKENLSFDPEKAFTAPGSVSKIFNVF